MSFDLDHLFICTDTEAPAADRLVELGLTEGARNQHPGQGTANRRFFFQDGMIELIWLANEVEARSDLVSRTMLFERCRYNQTGASPFGICLRPGGTEQLPDPFECWRYQPPYMPQGLALHVATSSTLIHEPMLVYLPFRIKDRGSAATHDQPTDHTLGVQRITRVSITAPPGASASAPLKSLQEMRWFSFQSGAEHVIEVEFDLNRQGQRTDLRPSLPLILNW